jgi:hypothetical protein
MLQFGLVKPDYTRGPPHEKAATQIRPFSAEHSSTKSNNQKRPSKLPSGMFNEDLADFDRDSEEEIAITKPPTTVQKIDDEALAQSVIDRIFSHKIMQLQPVAVTSSTALNSTTPFHH